MKFIRILGKKLREELRKKGVKYIELQKQQKLKEAKREKKREKMQRIASHQVMFNKKMMQRIGVIKPKFRGNSSKDLYNNETMMRNQKKL